MAPAISWLTNRTAADCCSAGQVSVSGARRGSCAGGGAGGGSGEPVPVQLLPVSAETGVFVSRVTPGKGPAPAAGYCGGSRPVFHCATIQCPPAYRPETG